MLSIVVGLALAVTQQPWQLENAKGQELYEQGRMQEAIPILEQARRHATAAQVAEVESARILDTLGACYEHTGRLSEARQLADLALAVRRSHLKAPNEAIAISLTNESSVYWALVKPEQALAFATEAKQMWEDLGLTTRREYFVALNNFITAELLHGDLRALRPVIAKDADLLLHQLAPSDAMLAPSLSVVATAY